MSSEINQYRKYVVDALWRSERERDGVVFGQEGVEYTRVINDAIVTNSQSRLRILTGTMSTRTHSALALLERLSRGPTLDVQILLDRLSDLSQSALGELGSYVDPSGPVRVRLLQQSAEPHMMIADAALLRLETNHAKRAGVVAFNRPGTCEKPVARFDGLWEKHGPSLSLAELRQRVAASPVQPVSAPLAAEAVSAPAAVVRPAAAAMAVAS